MKKAKPYVSRISGFYLKVNGERDYLLLHGRAPIVVKNTDGSPRIITSKWGKFSFDELPHKVQVQYEIDMSNLPENIFASFLNDVDKWIVGKWTFTGFEFSQSRNLFELEFAFSEPEDAVRFNLINK